MIFTLYMKHEFHDIKHDLLQGNHDLLRASELCTSYFNQGLIFHIHAIPVLLPNHSHNQVKLNYGNITVQRTIK